MSQADRFSPDAGLSLVEALMAVFIMALATSVIVLTSPPPPDPVEAELHRFSEMAEGLGRQAVISGTPMGLRFEEKSYAAVKWQAGAWVPVITGQLPDRMRLDLGKERQREREQEGETEWPDIEFSPLGTASGRPFILIADGRDIPLEINVAGNVIVGDSDE